MVRSWTPAEDALLRDLFQVQRLNMPEISARMDRTRSAIKNRVHKLGIQRTRGIPWSAAEDATIRALFANHTSRVVTQHLPGRTEYAVWRRARRLGLLKSAEHLAAMKEEAGRQVGLAGLGHRFPKGSVPVNKGVKRPGWHVGRMSEHWFKKGESRNKLPLGSTRVNSDGYLDRKVADTGYPPRDWKAVHIILWEQVHGPIPAGRRLAFKDRDKTHVALSNLELVTAAEMLRRNSIHRFSPELRSAIQMKAVLKRTIRSIDRGKKQDVGSAGSPVRNAGSAQGRGQADGR